MWEEICEQKVEQTQLRHIKKMKGNYFKSPWVPIFMQRVEFLIHNFHFYI